jgi:L,D-peptidoglycan transpeptidase YkuD (ErfK/YbiS/YcfS/YnhG family)
VTASNSCFAYAMFGPRECAKSHLGWTSPLKPLISLVSRMHARLCHVIYQGLGGSLGVPSGGFLRPLLFPGPFAPRDSPFEDIDGRSHETGLLGRGAVLADSDARGFGAGAERDDKRARPRSSLRPSRLSRENCMILRFPRRRLNSHPLATLRVRPLAGNRARGWLVAGDLRLPCALGPAGIVRRKREGDGGTPAGRFRLLFAFYRPDRKRPAAGGVALRVLRRDAGWCEDPRSGSYNRPVRLPFALACDSMWRADDLYDLTFVLDYNFTQRRKGAGSAIFFHLARPGLTPTAGCVAIRAADMRRLAPRLSAHATMRIG